MFEFFFELTPFFMLSFSYFSPTVFLDNTYDYYFTKSIIRFANENKILFFFTIVSCIPLHFFSFAVLLKFSFQWVFQQRGKVYEQQNPLFFLCLKMSSFYFHSFVCQFHWVENSRLTVILFRILNMFFLRLCNLFLLLITLLSV